MERQSFQNPSAAYMQNPFATPNGNPFSTPNHSGAPSVDEKPSSSYFGQSRGSNPRRRKFQSARLKPGEYDQKPWVLGKEDPNFKRKRWEKIIFWSGIGLGLLIGVGLCAYEYLNVSTGSFCLDFQDDFHDINPDIWDFEVQRGGFGTGSFDWTTSDKTNAYTDAEGLHIVPTLTTETTDITDAEILNGYKLNLTDVGDSVGKGTCTSHDEDYVNNCAIRSNKTSGAIVNPVRSARLTTKGKKFLKYGRVEVTAKMPVGDWLWPAIWMMPEDSVYGPWPQSGEIDIAECRGNSGRNYTDGSNSIGSTLHWGPSPAFDAFWRTTGKYNLKRGSFADDFHVYGLEWTENYLFMYIDTRLRQVFYIKFAAGADSMWNRGKFGSMVTENHTALFDPWTSSSDRNTPFNQDFYLILNVAVGGTNGYFQDGKGNKPWADGSYTAPLEFWSAKDTWLPTWGVGDTRGMTVQSVKMYKPGKC